MTAVALFVCFKRFFSPALYYHLAFQRIPEKRNADIRMRFYGAALVAAVIGVEIKTFPCESFQKHHARMWTAVRLHGGNSHGIGFLYHVAFVGLIVPVLEKVHRVVRDGTLVQMVFFV